MLHLDINYSCTMSYQRLKGAIKMSVIIAIKKDDVVYLGDDS